MTKDEWRRPGSHPECSVPPCLVRRIHRLHRFEHLRRLPSLIHCLVGVPKPGSGRPFLTWLTARVQELGIGLVNHG